MNSRAVDYVLAAVVIMIVVALVLLARYGLELFDLT